MLWGGYGAVGWLAMKKKAAISKRALILRMRRKLPGRKLVSDHRGHYRMIDLAANSVIDENVDLLKLAKELDCIRPWEEMR